MFVRSLAAAALVLAGCSTSPHYQGDVILGGFTLHATPVVDSCHLLGNFFPDGGGTAFFDFSGVFSYDTHTQVLYFDTDAVPEDDHVGTLTGRHFSVHSQTTNSMGCPANVAIDEVIEGDLFAENQDCAALEGDGGPASLPGDGGQVSGDGGQLSGDGGQVSGDGGQVSGDGGQLSGDGGQLSGDDWVSGFVPVVVCGGSLTDQGAACDAGSSGLDAGGRCRLVYQVTGKRGTGS